MVFEKPVPLIEAVIIRVVGLESLAVPSAPEPTPYHHDGLAG